jgi:cell division inhibitor SepF
MAGALRKTMVYLGLAEDDERYDVDEYAEDDLGDRRDQHREHHREHHRDAEVTHLPQRSVAEVVRTQPASGVSRITTIHPRTYNEAKVIGENFRDGIPVIMNLSDMGDADAKRLVDFAAGLVFGLHGSIERVTAKVFLLSPSTVEVGVEEAGVPSPRGLFNQS